MQKLTDIEIVLRFLNEYKEWIDGGMIMGQKVNIDGAEKTIGYRGSRNARELAKDMGDADEFEYRGEYNRIQYIIYGQKRINEDGKKIRQYRAKILFDPRTAISGYRPEALKISESGQMAFV